MPLDARQLEQRVKEGLAAALNSLGDRTMAEAIDRAPMETGALRASALGPGNDRASAATPDDLNVQVSFNTVYAAAQHEAHATMHRKGHSYEWEAHHYSQPGTGPKYLEGALKSLAPTAERIVADYVKYYLLHSGASSAQAREAVGGLSLTFPSHSGPGWVGSTDISNL